MSASRKSFPQVSADAPTWFDPLSPLGSAVRYVASLSPKYNWVGIYELKGKTLVLGPFLGAETEHRRIPVGKGVCGTAVAENRDLNVPDVAAQRNYLACSADTRSELVVLIRGRGGKILGQIDIDSHEPAAFSAAEEAHVRRVADELGERWPA
ncbi:MAG: GAF domain-containing protein [Bdellovibrionales bacterium]|nr:GAF domain-containing protein [Bdellovibrionales bacterium]